VLVRHNWLVLVDSRRRDRLGHASVQTTERYLGCKQNLGHPVNDLFDLRTDAREQAKDVESVLTNGAGEAVEKTSGRGIECGHGGSENEQPIGKQVSLPERTDLVKAGKGHRPRSLRRCSEAGTSRGHAGDKAESDTDQGTRGRLEVGTSLDPAS
jgi:hypothetical protein